MNDAIAALKGDQYRLGNCQILLYDRKRIDIFPEGYLTKLYQLCKSSGSCMNSSLGILPSLFCGMPDLSHDAITTYLATRPVLVPGIWTSPDSFMEAGLGFPSNLPVTGNRTGPERAMFAGYGLFRAVWGQPEAEILGMLGLAYFFLEFDVTAIHGLRYCENGLTARFTRKFGFRDVGTIPRYMLQNGKLVAATASTLLIEDFERYVERRLVELLHNGALDGRRQGRHKRTVGPGTTGDVVE